MLYGLADPKELEGRSLIILNDKYNYNNIRKLIYMGH